MYKSRSILDEINPNSARIYGVVARAARCAVVFRRGVFGSYCGIWQPMRSKPDNGSRDVCTSGVATYRQPATGSCISRLRFSTSLLLDGDKRPPYLTALALLPKGDCWGGGGLFHTQRHLRLNHRPNKIQLSAGFALPRRFQVEPLGDHSGRGEDAPDHVHAHDSGRLDPRPERR